MLVLHTHWTFLSTSGNRWKVNVYSSRHFYSSRIYISHYSATCISYSIPKAHVSTSITLNALPFYGCIELHRIKIWVCHSMDKSGLKVLFLRIISIVITEAVFLDGITKVGYIILRAISSRREYDVIRKGHLHWA